MRYILFGLFFLIGLGILIYPTVSNQWNTYRQSKLIGNYEKTVSQMVEEDFSEEWQSAYAYNQGLAYNALYTEVFGVASEEDRDSEYDKVLNVAGDGVMGYISVPKIKIKLAIYHGVSEPVLQTGVGHLGGTNLPIGGETNHSVLAAHRGLPSARLFTDIDQLTEGDMFYIHILDEIFAYQVDQISDMVDRNDAEALGTAMAREEGKDYVTLFTCTPYGVNSHRLLVRGIRVDYVPEPGEEGNEGAASVMLESVQNYYMLYLVIGLAVTLLFIPVVKVLVSRRSRKGRKKKQ